MKTKPTLIYDFKSYPGLNTNILRNLKLCRINNLTTNYIFKKLIFQVAKTSMTNPEGEIFSWINKTVDRNFP
ncbi:hypothetical protein M0Q97_09395 [Candidatus Dojkabacteria bacterium]|jgi:hypothetical protein|nr:hypothetical protein [Candidatus Dojkabacteria bacterium]